MDVGNRVIWNESATTIWEDSYECFSIYRNSKAEVIEVWRPSSRVKIRWNDSNNNRNEAWVKTCEVLIDTQYYRELKINMLLDESR